MKPDYEAVCDPNQSFRYLVHGSDSSLVRWHYHNEYELHLIECTEGRAFIGDYIGDFKPGALFLCGPFLPHNWVSLDHFEAGVRDRLVNFSREWVTQVIAAIPEYKSIRPMLENARYGIEFSSDDSQAVIDDLTAIDTAPPSEKATLFFKILTRLSASKNYRLLSSRSYETEADDASHARITEVVNYIIDNHTRPLSLTEAAAVLKLSPPFFSRWFKRVTGYRFIDFVTRVRISRACELLESTDSPITNICFESGFTNVANFNRHFRNIKGMTPRHYRESITIRHPLPTTHSKPKRV